MRSFVLVLEEHIHIQRFMVANSFVINHFVTNTNINKKTIDTAINKR